MKRVYRTAVLITAIFGVVTIFLVDRVPGSPLFILSYFTVQSNILVCLFLAAALLLKTRFHPAVHGAVTLYILITGLVFNTMLAPFMEVTGFSFINMHITHTAVPVLFVIDYLLNRERGKIRYKHLKYQLIYPVAYLIESSIEGGLTGFFRYPFLDYLNRPLPAYIIQLTIVIGVFIGFGLLLILIDRKSIRQENSV